MSSSWKSKVSGGGGRVLDTIRLKCFKETVRQNQEGGHAETV